MYNLGHDPNTLKILYDMNKETGIMIRTPAENTENVQVKEMVKQSTIFRPINGKTKHNISTHHLMCRNIHS